MSIRTVIAAILACSISIFPAMASETDEAAYLMVKTLGLGNNLSQISLRVATTTETFGIIAKKLGNEKAMALVKQDIANVRPKYQDKWDHNLAQSYAEYFDTAELHSITNEKKLSKYFGKFQSKQSDVGKRMQEKTLPVLTEYISEVMNMSYTKALQ